MSDEGCLPLMTIFDVNIVVPPVNVKLGKVVSVFQLVHEVRDEEKGVGIAGGMFIEVAVVLAGVEFSILFLNEEERGGL